MTTQEFANLETTIQKWTDKMVDNSNTRIVWGSETVRHMAKAAAAVFNACEESQEYGVREGLLS